MINYTNENWEGAPYKYNVDWPTDFGTIISYTTIWVYPECIDGQHYFLVHHQISCQNN